MKRVYQTPEIQVLGSVEELTQAFDATTSADTITYSGHTIPGTQGSVSGVVIPG